MSGQKNENAIDLSKDDHSTNDNVCQATAPNEQSQDEVYHRQNTVKIEDGDNERKFKIYLFFL